MNAPHPLQKQLTAEDTYTNRQEDREINLLEYWDIILDNRWLVGAITALSLFVGGAYALLADPVYESNLLIQVEDSSGSAKSFLGEAAGLLDVKTPATAELEILRSRLVIGRAVDSTRFYITAGPRYLPLVGTWLARRATELSTPGLLGFGGWVSGTEKIEIGAFEVPQTLEGSTFRLTAIGDKRYELAHPSLPGPLKGEVGTPLHATIASGGISLRVTELTAKSGAEFNLSRNSQLQAINVLQSGLALTEKGRQSGIIEATLQGIDREKLVSILNEIGKQYVQQNIDRKAAEARKTLNFLDDQLPQIKQQLEKSEQIYNAYRNRHGTVALDEEAKLLLARTVELQSRLIEAKQKRVDLVSRFTIEHPTVKTLDSQLTAWNSEIAALNIQVQRLPAVQQDALRLERDVKINNELYQQLRNNALQLELIREGKTGNVRIIDSAVAPEAPIKPRRLIAMTLSGLIGLLGGIAFAFTRNAFFRGIKSPQEIEAQTGLNVYSTIPLSDTQESLAQAVAAKQHGIHILAEKAPHDNAIESLRSLRTALQFSLLDAKNNRILISGATPGVGKSFVSSNFAAVLANAGKRVLLIDADLRKGHLNQYFGVPRNNGLSELIAGTIGQSEAIHRQILPNLDLLATGVLPPNPAEIMSSDALSRVLQDISPQYDLVIIDTAPVLVAADTVAVGVHAGTILLVARAEQTQLGDLHESARRLRHAGKTVSGVLFNAVDLTRHHYGHYGYNYGGYKYRHYTYET